MRIRGYMPWRLRAFWLTVRIWRKPWHKVGEGIDYDPFDDIDFKLAWDVAKGIWAPD